MKKTGFTAIIIAIALALCLCAGCVNTQKAPDTVTIAAMKGPTAMGLVKFMDDNENSTSPEYDFQILGTSDSIVTGLKQGTIDIACVPCNLAAVLYKSLEGAVSVAAINTLGVLYVVENGDTVHSIDDLHGKTIYTTGKGTTPEYSLRYVLEQNGITDADVQFKSESAEIAALLASGEEIIAVLPQPYVTTAQIANSDIRIALSLEEEWKKVSPTGAIVTGVVVVRNEFLENNKDYFNTFLDDYKASAEYTKTDVDGAAALCEKFDIFKAAVVKKALPYCNITFVTGSEMKTKVSEYLNVLFESNPASVGGSMPGDAFYYIAD